MVAECGAIKPYLIVVRAGDNSLHEKWLTGAPDFDLVVSYYGQKPERFARDGVRVVHQSGPKWPGLAAFLAQNPSLSDRYRYVWFPDDDLDVDCETINRFFRLVDEKGFGLAQPALLRKSYFSHTITLQGWLCDYRLTNFVEIMAPCFSVDVLRALQWTFTENTSGWGLEWLWMHYAERNGVAMAIVDSTPVFHTRPVGSAGSGGALESPRAEWRRLMEKYQMDKKPMRNVRFAPGYAIIAYHLQKVYESYRRRLTRLGRRFSKN